MGKTIILNLFAGPGSDQDIKDLLKHYRVDFEYIDGDETAVDKLTKKIINLLEK